MSRRPRSFALSLLVVPLLAANLAASARAQESERTLVIGTKAAEPFAIAGPDGSWNGISIELWEEIAERSGAAGSSSTAKPTWRASSTAWPTGPSTSGWRR